MTNRIPLTLLVVGSLGACAELDRGTTPVEVTDAAADVADTGHETGDATTADVPEDATEEADTAAPLSYGGDGVHDLLIANCTPTGCHGAGAGGFTLSGDVEADYQATFNEVVPGDALASKLIKKGTATSSHTGGPVLQVGTPEYDLVVAWINGGANP